MVETAGRAGTTAARPSNRAPEGVIAPIQYLRGIAAMSIVPLHSISRGNDVDRVSFDSSLVPSGVDLFFVVSGFIMWVTTVEKPMTSGAFMVRRIIRIVPIYWFVTLLTVFCKLIPGALPHCTYLHQPS